MKKILLASTLILSFALTSCDRILDVNENPNYPSTVEPSLEFPGGVLYTVAKVGYEYELAGTLWSQHGTQGSTTNQYVKIMDMSISYADNLFSSPWNNIYAVAIPSFKRVIEKCEAKSNPDKYLSYIVASKVMIAYNFHLLTSAFDKCPYDEAFLGNENLNPKYNTGEELQSKIITILEEVLATDQTKLGGAVVMGSSDQIFNGNTKNWLKFANTLYLKMLLRDPTVNAAKITTCLSNPIGFLDNADAAFTAFNDEANKSNPLYESDRRQLNTAQNIRACSDVVNYLTAANDPRLTVFYDTPIGGTIVGAAYGAAVVAPANFSRIRLGATDPVYFASVAEAYFLQAEAYARQGNAASAKANYDNGVKAAFSRWNLDGSSFIAAGGAYEFNSSATTEQMIEQIITQKWLAAIRSQAWDSWFDLNRTGYPKRGTTLTDYSGTLNTGQYARRFLYPQRSLDYNSNAPQVEPIYTKMWWHK